ncbi:hypothetical protein [Candidatus Nitrospira neomarina]|uniref:Uncharacterized protein n=1 Tax=Candidatus Nitrospira neomarina TaxID=3020899 RepID=A0AA96K2B6_9BACT|nr:hypothetical protein [Candidatus Nitrospira neomarina]WNM61454.1 hypothetical protein PQG83_17090 [Candidatus Nitrospira neomarina]
MSDSPATIQPLSQISATGSLEVSMKDVSEMCGEFRDEYGKGRNSLDECPDWSKV